MGVVEQQRGDHQAAEQGEQRDRQRQVEEGVHAQGEGDEGEEGRPGDGSHGRAGPGGIQFPADQRAAVGDQRAHGDGLQRGQQHEPGEQHPLEQARSPAGRGVEVAVAEQEDGGDRAEAHGAVTEAQQDGRPR